MAQTEESTYTSLPFVRAEFSELRALSHPMSTPAHAQRRRGGEHVALCLERIKCGRLPVCLQTPATFPHGLHIRQFRLWHYHATVALSLPLPAFLGIDMALCFWQVLKELMDMHAQHR